jgi:hypothetical protein
MRYSRAKLAVYCAVRISRFAQRKCQLPSVVKDLSFRSQILIGTSPRQAERNAGLEPACDLRFVWFFFCPCGQQKNPASSAGRIRPLLGPLNLSALERMCSKLDFFLPGVRNQPHLWMSRQAPSVSRLPTNQGSTNIRRVYQNFRWRQAEDVISAHALLWNSLIVWKFRPGACAVESRSARYRRIWRLIDLILSGASA